MTITIYDKMTDPDTFVPPHMRDGFTLWIERGDAGGSFQTAIFENNLMEAFGLADAITRSCLYTICSWIYSYAPRACHGSKEVCADWAEYVKEQQIA